MEVTGRIGVMEWWSIGVLGSDRSQYSITPVLQRVPLLFPQHSLQRSVLSERFGAVEVFFKVQASFDQVEDDILDAFVGDQRGPI